MTNLFEICRGTHSLGFVSIEKIYQTLETVFHRLSKHLDFVKNTPLRFVFSTLFSVFGYPDETLSLVFDILHETLALVFEISHKLVIFHLSWQDLCHNVDHSFENPPNSKYSIHLAHAQTKCPCAAFVMYCNGRFHTRGRRNLLDEGQQFKHSEKSFHWWFTREIPSNCEVRRLKSLQI